MTGVRFLAPLLLALLSGPLAAQPTTSEQPSSPSPRHEQARAAPARLSLIIDDLGQTPGRDRRVLALPGPVALAILPDTPHAAQLAEEAHRRGKTVMLHLPMDPAGGRYAWHPGLPVDELERRLDTAFDAVPHARGVNNHMGSRMTADATAMNWLMGELQRRHRFFIDSRTSAATIAGATAQRVGLASLSRDVFLDNEPTADAIAAQLEKAVVLARKQGSVVVIGHPYPATLEVLERELPRLAARGIDWIGVEQMIAVRGNRAMAAHGKGGIYR